MTELRGVMPPMTTCFDDRDAVDTSAVARQVEWMIDAGVPSLVMVAKTLAMKRPNVSVLIDGLVERGLVERSRSTDDGRRIELALTDKGDELLDTAESQCGAALQHDGRPPVDLLE